VAFIPGETNSRSRSLLLREPLSPESDILMNVIDNAMKPLENKPNSAQDLPERTNSCVRVEPCEFESLLQRAMEILSIRAQSATPSRS